MDDVVADLRVMMIKQWTEKTKGREQWRLVVEEAEAHPGLLRREDGWTFLLHTIYYTNSQIIILVVVQC
jgi:hypothetical protein